MSEANRVAVGLLERNYYSYSNFTIPHPPAVGAPFRAMWALFCPLARVFNGIPFRYVRVCSRLGLDWRPRMTGLSTVPQGLRADEERPYLFYQR